MGRQRRMPMSKRCMTLGGLALLLALGLSPGLSAAQPPPPTPPHPPPRAADAAPRRQAAARALRHLPRAAGEHGPRQAVQAPPRPRRHGVLLLPRAARPPGAGDAANDAGG